MQILLVEDDFLQADSIRDQLERGFPGVVIEHVSTESEFRTRFTETSQNVPDVVVLDLMLRWTDPGPDSIQPPEDVRHGGSHRAGVRCQALLANHPQTENIPVVLYSALDPTDMQRAMGESARNVVYLSKGTDEIRLIRLIRGLLQAKERIAPTLPSVFVVHGHDEEAKESVARFIERLRLKAIILHEQASLGSTVIEKFERYASVNFAVVLLTPDDVGALRGQQKSLKPRARQNVIFELGFFVAQLGRRNVCALYKEGVEVPSDIQGLLYIPMDTGGAWRIQLARELQAAGIRIDMHRLLGP